MKIGRPVSSTHITSPSRMASSARSRFASAAARGSRCLNRFRLRDTRRAPGPSISSSAPVPRSIFENARDVARALADTEAFERSRHDRKRVEMLFAHLKRSYKRTSESASDENTSRRSETPGLLHFDRARLQAKLELRAMTNSQCIRDTAGIAGPLAAYVPLRHISRASRDSPQRQRSNCNSERKRCVGGGWECDADRSRLLPARPS
jgi:hypothetical protein